MYDVAGNVLEYGNPPEMTESHLIAAGHALHGIPRFNGHIPRHWSVAQHCLLVAEISAIFAEMEESDPIAPRRYGLMHDVEEAWCCDLPSPLKRWLKENIEGFADGWKELTDGFNEKAHAAAGLSWPVPRGIEKLVKRADNEALALETMWLHSGTPLDAYLATPILTPAMLIRFEQLTGWHWYQEVSKERYTK